MHILQTSIILLALVGMVVAVGLQIRRTRRETQQWRDHLRRLSDSPI